MLARLQSLAQATRSTRSGNRAKNDTPTMGGFIERQSDKYEATPGNSSFVIKAYDPKKSNTLMTLAKNFGFWDTYHAEHPGPTNPNRQFATSGSTCGMVDNTDQASGWFANVTGTDCAVSIFEALDKKNISWKNYYVSHECISTACVAERQQLTSSPWNRRPTSLMPSNTSTSRRTRWRS